ncbi:hypothetical protein [Niveibacterium sp. SC-1]|uniref:hypothetical protein n=1 Tax=Niveibacterium sp. SC-1 TaxID=3135646 RepID=UPI00311D7E53
MSTRDVPEQDAEASPSMMAAATLFMMSRYAENPSADSAESVILHLECVAEDERCDPLMREVCAALAQRWQIHAAQPCLAHGAPGASLQH